MAGDDYYPQYKTSDWIKTYETLEEAQNQVKEIPGFHHRLGYQIEGNTYDWYTIVDLRKWIGEIY